MDVCNSWYYVNPLEKIKIVIFLKFIHLNVNSILNMSLDILKNQKNNLIRRAIARSYMKSSLSGCPVCRKIKHIKSVSEIKNTMKKINSQFHPEQV